MAQTIEDYQDGSRIRIRDYGKSLRRLVVATMIIGAAIWFSDFPEVVNVADAPVQLDQTTTGANGRADKAKVPATETISAAQESS